MGKASPPGIVYHAYLFPKENDLFSSLCRSGNYGAEGHGFLIGQQYPVYQDEESNIKEEIGLVRDLAHNDKATLPSDYGSQYRAWRITQLSSEDSGTNNTEAVDNGEAVNSETSNTSNVETANNELTFTSCNETVYATSQVNLRSGPGTNYDKVGSLKSGASIVRTGIGTDKCVGWSRVEVSDGSIVYVSSKYLSTSKPVQQQTNTNTNTGSNTGGSQTNTNTSDSNKPPSGGKAMYGGFNTYEEYINDLHRTHPDFTIEELKDIFPDLATGHVDEEAARGDAAAGLLG